MSKKLNSAYKSIGEVAEILKLKNSQNGKLNTYILRFWEKQFKQIKPVIFNNRRRYYDKDTVDLLMRIKYLLKDKGMTIKGVKNILKNNINSLDDYDLNSLKADYQKKNIELKSKKVLDKIKVLKNYGKKNTH